MPAAVTGYEIGLFIHLMAVVLAFGPTFGYAFFQVVTERTNPRGVPAMWKATETANTFLVTPAAILALAAGLYLTIDAWEFSDLFINVGLIAIIVLLGLVHGFFNPRGRKAIEYAERDIAASGTGEVKLSDEYWAVSKLLAQVGSIAGLIVLLTMFLMTVKP